MESVPEHRICLSPRALLRRARRRAAALERSCPATLFLLAAVTAVLSVQEDGFPFILIPAASVLLVWALLPTRDALLRFALPMIPALISAQIWSARQQNFIAGEAGRARFAAEAELIVDDPSASVQPGEAFRVKNLQCRVKWLRYGANGPWVEFKGTAPRVLMNFRRDDELAKVPLGFGDVIRAEGVFSAPEPPLFPGSFDYAAYLEREEIYELFRPESMTIVSRGWGFRRTLYDWRDAALSKICSGFRNVENVRLACAMLGGRRIPMEKETRAGFLSSGTIHILTVSGTHVGIFASLLLLLLAWMPFRKRCLIVLAPLLLYALSTGMREPAMRAYVMIAVFLILRSMLLTAPHINSLMLAGYAILLISPSSLMKPGMYYSFLAVALLLSLPNDLGSKSLAVFSRKLTQPLPAQYLPVPRRRRAFCLRVLLSTVIATSVASLGSGVLSILYQGLFPISSVPANILVMPLAYLAFLFAGITFAFAWLPPVLRVLSGATEIVFTLIGRLGRFFGGLFETSVPKPPVWTVVLFIAALFVLIRSRSWRRGAAAAALMTALAFYWRFGASFLPPEILIADGGGTEIEPVVVITDPALGRADVVNVPDFKTGMAMADYLRSRGISVCRTVSVSSGRKSSFGGLEAFAGEIPVLNVYCPKNALQKMPSGPTVTALPYDGDPVSCRLSGKQFLFSIGTIDGILVSKQTGEGRLTLRKNGITIHDDEIPQLSVRRLKIQPLERTSP